MLNRLLQFFFLTYLLATARTSPAPRPVRRWLEYQPLFTDSVTADLKEVDRRVIEESVTQLYQEFNELNQKMGEEPLADIVPFMLRKGLKSANRYEALVNFIYKKISGPLEADKRAKIEYLQKKFTSEFLEKLEKVNDPRLAYSQLEAMLYDPKVPEAARSVLMIGTLSFTGDILSAQEINQSQLATMQKQLQKETSELADKLNIQSSHVTDLLQEQKQDFIKLKAEFKEVGELFQQAIKGNDLAQEKLIKLGFEVEQVTEAVAEIRDFYANQKTIKAREANWKGYQSAFQFMAQLGAVSNNPGLVRAGTIGAAGISILGAIDQYKSLPLDASLGMVLNPISAMASGVLSIVSTFMQDEGSSELGEYLAIIHQEVTQVRQEMHTRFDRVELGMQSMLSQLMQALDVVLDTLQFNQERLAIYLKYNFDGLFIKLDMLGTHIDYGFKQAALNSLKQKNRLIAQPNHLHSLPSTALEEHRSYFEEWLLETSRDPLFNGEVYAWSNSNNAARLFDATRTNTALGANPTNTTVQNRLGYLAAYAHHLVPEFPAKSLIHPQIFAMAWHAYEKVLLASLEHADKKTLVHCIKTLAEMKAHGPEALMSFITEVQGNAALWQGLVSEYLSIVKALKARAVQVFKDMPFNDLGKGSKLLPPTESLDEVIAKAMPKSFGGREIMKGGIDNHLFKTYTAIHTQGTSIRRPGDYIDQLKDKTLPNEISIAESLSLIELRVESQSCMKCHDRDLWTSFNRGVEHCKYGTDTVNIRIDDTEIHSGHGLIAVFNEGVKRATVEARKRLQARHEEIKTLYASHIQNQRDALRSDANFIAQLDRLDALESTIQAYAVLMGVDAANITSNLTTHKMINQTLADPELAINLPEQFDTILAVPLANYTGNSTAALASHTATQSPLYVEMQKLQDRIEYRITSTEAQIASLERRPARSAASSAKPIVSPPTATPSLDDPQIINLLLALTQEVKEGKAQMDAMQAEIKRLSAQPSSAAVFQTQETAEASVGPRGELNL